MITTDAIEEALSLLSGMMTLLRACGNTSDQKAAADLKYGIDDLLSNAEDAILGNSIVAEIVDVYRLALNAGATVATVEVVRQSLVSALPVSDLAGLIAAAGIQSCLALEVGIYAGTTFVSRDDIDTAIAQINDAFELAEIFAGDNDLTGSFQALLKAHSAIIQYLATGERSLPRIVPYSVGRVMTSTSLAQLLYGDPSRADQLVAENRVINPCFMPLSGRALSL